MIVLLHCHYAFSLITAECVLPCTELGYAPNPTCTACIEVHICLIGDPCENGATCNIGLTNTTDYNCSCTYNHTGLNCEGENTSITILV